MTPPGYVSIGQFARATGLTAKALRLYAAAGVLEPATVDESSGYRFYRPDQIVTGQVVRTLRDLGVPVVEVPKVLAALAEGTDAVTLLADRIRADAALLAHRRHLLSRLDIRLKGSAMTRPVSVRSWTADPALLVHGTITLAELDAFLTDAYQRMYNAAGSGPLTLSAPAYNRYHGRVDDEDTRVAIDACLPFAGDRAQPRDLPAGVEILPAATFDFASTVMRSAEAVYPRILEGSDAVGEWMANHGFDYAGPAYEIFRVWTGEIGHERNVVEVGFPIRDAG